MKISPRRRSRDSRKDMFGGQEYNGRPNDNETEKAKRLKLREVYRRDMEKAKFMSAGKLQDVVAIKGKFVVPDHNLSGAFIAFINIAQEYISSVKTVLSTNTGSYTKVRIFDDWKTLYKNIQAYETGGDSADSGRLTSNILDLMIKRDIFPDVQKMNLEYLSVALQDMIKEIFKSEKAKCQVDLEKQAYGHELMGIEVMSPSQTLIRIQFDVLNRSLKKVRNPFRKKLSEIESKSSLIVVRAAVYSPRLRVNLLERFPQVKGYSFHLLPGILYLREN
jgi:hypothetical protein